MTETNPQRKKTSSLICSFCGKSDKEVKAIVCGPNVYICSECIGVVLSIVMEEGTQEAKYEALQCIKSTQETKHD